MWRAGISVMAVGPGRDRMSSGICQRSGLRNDHSLLQRGAVTPDAWVVQPASSLPQDTAGPGWGSPAKSYGMCESEQVHYFQVPRMRGGGS